MKTSKQLIEEFNVFSETWMAHLKAHTAYTSIEEWAIKSLGLPESSQMRDIRDAYQKAIGQAVLKEQEKNAQDY